MGQESRLPAFGFHVFGQAGPHWAQAPRLSQAGEGGPTRALRPPSPGLLLAPLLWEALNPDKFPGASEGTRADSEAGREALGARLPQQLEEVTLHPSWPGGPCSCTRVGQVPPQVIFLGVTAMKRVPGGSAHLDWSLYPAQKASSNKHLVLMGPSASTSPSFPPPFSFHRSHSPFSCFLSNSAVRSTCG